MICDPPKIIVLIYKFEIFYDHRLWQDLQFNYRKVFFSFFNMKNGFYERALSIYDFCVFKVELHQKQCLQHLEFTYSNEAPYRSTVFMWFTEFRKDRNYLLHEEHTGRPLSAVVLEYLSAVQKILINDNLCNYQMRQKGIYIGFTAIYRIIYEKLHMKKSCL